MVGELTYKIVKPTGIPYSSAVFSSKTLNAKTKQCENNGVAGIAKISGTPTKNITGEAEFYKVRMNDIKQFDGFFLFYQGAQATCHSGDNSLDRQLMQIVENGLKNAVLIN